jgi:dTDP-4-amino-4,6-dideoxygalactose transaminase
VQRLAGDDGPAEKVTGSLLAAQDTGRLRHEEYLLSRGAGGEFRVVLARPLAPAVPAGAAAPAGAAEPAGAARSAGLTGPAALARGVVVCPGRNAVLGQVTGQQPPDYPDRDVAAQLSQAGFVTVTLGYGLDGVLDPAVLAGRDEASVLAQAYATAGQPLVGVLARDALTAAAWLAGRLAGPAAGGGTAPVALLGHSLGAAVALYAGLLDDLARPLCLASYLGSFAVLAHGGGAAMLPGIGAHADLPELYGALAPAPLQVQYGLRDPNLDPADAARAGTVITGIYQAAGAAGRAEIVAAPMGHGTDVPAAIGFLRAALDDQPAAPPALVPPARPYFDAGMRTEIGAAIDGTLRSGLLTLGPQVARFERELAAWTGAVTVTVSSGSAALELIMRQIGVAGRTVLVPANTFFATAASALRAGAQVDFVDLEPAGLGLAPESLAERLDAHPGQVAAVVVMHTGGIVSPGLRQVIELCHGRGIPVVEDAAHALGSRLDGVPAGSIADFGAYSFYPTKVLTSAEGGAVVAADEGHLDRLRRVRDHGRSRDSATRHDLLGTNWRLSELHAAVGLAQAGRLAGQIALRAQAAARYDQLLAGLGAAEPYRLPPGVTTSWYKYIVLLRDARIGRAELKDRLRRSQVALAGEVYDTLLPDQPYFAGHPGTGGLRQARAFAAGHICLPVYPDITADEQERVASALHRELG